MKALLMARPLTHQRGFFYAEVILSIALLAILLIPAIQALNSGIINRPSGIAAQQLNLASKMEEVLSKPFGAIYAETYLSGGNTNASVSANYSDLQGVQNRRVVVFYRFDPITNTVSAADTGLLYVSVYYESLGSANALNTLVGRWW